jgi:hypothetical protein
VIITSDTTDPAETLEVAPMTTNEFSRKLFRCTLFGTTLGGLCGSGYGVMEKFSTPEGRRPEKMGEALGAIRTNALLFGGVFAAYQVAKESMRYYRGTKRADPFDPTNSISAGAIAVLPMALHPLTRKMMPHLACLVGVDMLNESGYKPY